MKIWFDLSNSPHINLFAPLIRELSPDHEVIITCRPLANTIDLLRLHGFPFQVVGRHYGARTFNKIIGYPVRVSQLYRYLKQRELDVAVSQSSFHSPVVARLLSVRSIYMNDNEHAVGNVPAFIFAHTIMIPEYLERRRVHRQGARDNKIVQYPGVKEGIYLWNLTGLNGNKNSSSRNSEPKTVYIRPEPWTAQYYKGRVNFLDSLLTGLKEHVRVILLPRGDAQAVHYRKPEFSRIEVLEKPRGLAEIACDCGLFIGAGGTMTREMAVLGVPTISIYQSALLDVDRHLISIGQMIHRPQLETDFALSYLERCERRPPNNELLSKGKQAYDMIRLAILGKLSS